MSKIEEKVTENHNYRELWRIIAGVRIIFLISSVFNSTVDLGLAFSILSIADTATSIVIGLFFTTIINIILLISYLYMVKERNNQSIFIVYIVEILSLIYGLLGIYAYLRYINEIEFITISAVIGMIGLVDLIIVNIFIGGFFFQGKVNDRLVEVAIGINIIILVGLLFI